MRDQSTIVETRRILAACVITLGIGNCFAAAQEQEPGEGARQLWDTGFIKQRPAAAKTGSAVKPPNYRPVTSAVPKGDAGMEDAIVGLTFWRLRRPATGDDQQARLLVLEEDNSTAEWIPERVAAETPLSEGQRVRLSVEVPRTGFLYVIDREQYADGSMGDPYLIFPDLRIRGGDNAVTAGKVIEIPAQDGKPPYFRLRRSRPDQAAEVFTLLVTLKPLPDLKIGRKALPLSEEQLKTWEKKWGARTQRFELADGAGKPWTRAEKEAGAEANKLLTQDEPCPQTMYRVAARPGEPIMMKVPLQIRK